MTNTAFTGTTRTEYLVWVQNWKTEYKALSAQIRTAKTQRKENLWSYRAKGDTSSKKRTVVGENPNYNPRAASAAQYLSKQATAMLELRAEAKLIAKQQYEASLSAAA